MIPRVLASAILLLSVCAFPLAVTVIFALACLVLFKNYFELIPIFFVADALYGLGTERFFMIPLVMTLFATLGVLLSNILRARLFNKKAYI